MMRLTTFLLFVVFLQAGAEGFSQQKITLSYQQASLEKIFREISRQSGYDFLYDDRTLSRTNIVNINIRNASLKEALSQCLKDQPLTYTILNKTIIVNEQDSPEKPELSLYIPVIRLSGTVTDSATGKPLPGVSIQVKNSTTGTTTDTNGQFSLDVPDNGVLLLSYIGYEKKEIPVNGRTTITVSLMPSTTGLDQLVIVGYGVQKKVDLTGAVSQISGEQVVGNRPVTSIGQALQGQIPGLQMKVANGKPGQPWQFNIRGMTSINGGSPLILVDGVEMDPSFIPPDDIANISVLKDAAAAAIYGARAAFGVVLITTKKGEKNKHPEITYSNNFAWNVPTTLPEKVDPVTQIKVGAMAWANGGLTNYFGKDPNIWLNLYDTVKERNTYRIVNGTFYELGNTNMIKEMTETGFIQQHNISVRGGSQKVTYYISGGLMGENGVLVLDKDRFSRKNVGADIETDITDWLSVEGNFGYIRNEQDFPFIANGESYLYQVSYFRPTFWLTGIDDQSIDGRTATGLPWGFSPAMVGYGAKNTYISDNTNIQLVATMHPLPGLELKGRYTLRRETNDNMEHVNSYQMPDPGSGIVQYYHNQPNQLTRTAGFSDYQVMEAWGQYDKTIGRRHNFKLMAGYSQEKSRASSYYSKAQGLVSDDVPALSLATGNLFVGDNVDKWAVQSVFSRLNYNYSEKYLAEAVIRYDGSSRFPAGSRFVLLPSFSLGWNIGRENFMQWSSGWLDGLKLRASYGEQGNQSIGTYDYLSTMGVSRANWIVANNKPVIVTPGGLVSSNFTWEDVKSTNIGLDFALLNGSLTGTVEVYQRRTEGMLTAGQVLPATLGTSAPKENAANLKVNGWELTLGWNKKLAKDLSLRVGFNVYDAMATITHYANPNKLLSTYYDGEHIGEIWGYVTDRLFTDQDFITKPSGVRDYAPGIANENIYFRNQVPMPGDVKYADLNGNDSISTGSNTLSDPGDRKIIGNNTPRYQFGLNLDIQWKGFSASLLFQGVAKRDLWMGSSLIFAGIDGGNYYSTFTNTLNFWTPEHPNAFYPRPIGNSITGNIQTQTRYLQNAAYMRLKNLTLGYTLPAYIARKLKVNSIRAFVSGENLWMISGLPKGVDPELGDNITFPLEKDYSFGFTIQL